MRIIGDLPAPITIAIRNDPYTSGLADWTPSSLNDPARVRALSRRHRDEMVVKASSMWRLFLGQMVHAVMERLELPPNCRKEERLYADWNGHKIGGQFDLYVGEGGLAAGDLPCDQDILPYTILDFKTLMSYAVVFAQKNGGKDEWKSQLATLGWLGRKNGMRVDRVQTIPLLLDWKADEALDSPDYPQKPSLILDSQEWDDARVEAFFAEKIARHEACGPDVPDDELPACTPEERWERQPKWAAMKPGRDKAVKLEDTKEALVSYLERKNMRVSDHELVFRPGKQIRCRSFCNVARFCDFGQQELRKLEEENA